MKRRVTLSVAVLVLAATPALARDARVRGKLAEAGELLDGGIEAARLSGNTQALVSSRVKRIAASVPVANSSRLRRL